MEGQLNAANVVEGGFPPRRRALLLTAFLACLSFLIFGINALITFIINLTKTEELWNYLNSTNFRDIFLNDDNC